MKYKVAKKIAKTICKKTKVGTSAKIKVVGSVRRKVDEPRDMDFLVIVKDKYVDESPLKEIKIPSQFQIIKKISAGLKRTSFRLKDTKTGEQFQADFFLTKKSDLPYALLHHTGSAIYNIRLRSDAKRKGWRLNQYGLFVGSTTERVKGTAKFKKEKEVVEFIGHEYKSPSDRNDK